MGHARHALSCAASQREMPNHDSKVLMNTCIDSMVGMQDIWAHR